MISAIIVAAGKGIRMDDTVRKQYLLLAGRPILGHTLPAFDVCNLIDKIFLVVPEEDFEFCHKNILSPLNLQKKVGLVSGGTERQDSVYNGLLAIDNKGGIVVIHDGVRPFISPEQLAACINGAKEHGACILGIPAYDTVKSVSSSGYIDKTLERDTIWLAQTPQAFKYDLIIKAHENAKQEGFTGTDDAMLVERLGINVRVIRGNRYNIKITTREDLLLARAILQAGLAVLQPLSHKDTKGSI